MSKTELDVLEQQIHAAAEKVGSKQLVADMLTRIAAHYYAAAVSEEKPGIPPDT